MGFCFSQRKVGFEPIQVQLSGGQLLPPVQKLVATIHSAKQNGNQIPPAPQNKYHWFPRIPQSSKNQLTFRNFAAIIFRL